MATVRCVDFTAPCFFFDYSCYRLYIYYWTYDTLNYTVFDSEF